MLDLNTSLGFFQRHYQNAAEKLFRVILPRAHVNAIIMALPTKQGLPPLIHFKEPTIDIEEFLPARKKLLGLSTESSPLRQLINDAYESIDRKYKTHSFNRVFETRLSEKLGYVYCCVVQIPKSHMETMPYVSETYLKEIGMPGSIVESAMDTMAYDAYRVLRDDDPSSYFRAFSDTHSLARSSAVGFINSFCRLMPSLVDPQCMYDSLNEISSAPYEGQESLGTIVFSANFSALPDLEIVRFERPIPLDKHKWARKIVQMSSQDFFVLHDNQHIIGLGRGSLISESSIRQSIRIEFTGAHKWQLYRGPTRLMHVYLGLPSAPYEPIDIPETAKVIIDKFTLHDKQDSVSRIVDIISSIVGESIEKRHGAMLVITSPELAHTEASRLGQQAIQLAPSDSKRLILQASRIDGAMLLDTNGRCHAIGVILDGIASPDAGEDSSRGARYNSAVRYANTNKNCLILVISEDGYINFLGVNGTVQ